MIKSATKLALAAALLAIPLGGCSQFGMVNIPLNGFGSPAEPAPVAQEAAPAPSVPRVERANAFADLPLNGNDAPIDTGDDLAIAKRHFAATNYGLAEQHFRRAVEKPTGPKSRDAEAWLGLAASYDNLRRFEL